MLCATCLVDLPFHCRTLVCCAHESGYPIRFSGPLPLRIPGLPQRHFSSLQSHTNPRLPHQSYLGAGRRLTPDNNSTRGVDLISMAMLETEFSSSLWLPRSALASNTIVMDSWRTHARHSKPTKADTCYRNLDFLVNTSSPPSPSVLSLSQKKANSRASL
ncbi:hypothetical protein PHLGIDRAFT_393941 [Phlebiopsis gigantea 11061_1 CR5-6]|uniref:Uncharacterized protein n=1 Tax=Phlebiopsis gigantea (strain 11061_1 CR5-6) TaxID=745531 RepID=A0A0C3S969_PHLG1|nr:hypothetical protein PHLGIDRAFT_393941 [Phlebiopsis gigantea 11061_1 CR5-6]